MSLQNKPTPIPGCTSHSMPTQASSLLPDSLYYCSSPPKDTRCEATNHAHTLAVQTSACYTIMGFKPHPLSISCDIILDVPVNFIKLFTMPRFLTDVIFPPCVNLASNHTSFLPETCCYPHSWMWFKPCPLT